MDSFAISQAHAAASDLANHYSPMMRIISMFFTPAHRRAAHAVYAFFRTADDLVDEGHVSLEQFRACQMRRQGSWCEVVILLMGYFSRPATTISCM
jgi:phytoene/squalene synthetase